MTNVKKLNEKHEFLNYPNVVGFSEKLRKKESEGVILDVDSIKIYVQKKVPLDTLKDSEKIPKTINGIPTDIVEIGEVWALDAVPLADPQREKLRPLKAGISVGNRTITAGTIGWWYTKDGTEYLGSNAHVLAEDPSSDPSIGVKQVVQPGRADGGLVPADWIGDYEWHQKVYPIGGVTPGCPVTKTIEWALNGIYSVAGRQSRFRAYTSLPNYHDFAVASLKSGIDRELTTFHFDPIALDYKLAGLCFAGGSTASFICKVGYQISAGYTPVGVSTDVVSVGDRIRKSGRTTGDTEGTVRDDAVSVTVNYGSFKALIQDTIMTTKFLEGGDSGSSAWKL